MTILLLIKRKLQWTIAPVLCLSIVFCFSAGLKAQQSNQAASPKHCLWVLENAANKFFLMGSLHVLKKDAYPLPKAINDAYGVSQKVVFETDMEAMLDPAVSSRMMQLGLYPEGETLFQHTSAELQRSLKKKMTGLGLSLDHFVRFRPWVIAVTLTTLELQRLGFSPAYGIDIHFHERARAD